MTPRSHRGFSLVEMLLVATIVLVASAVAVPLLARARRAADLGDAETTTRAVLRTAITRAAARTEATPLLAAELVHADGVVINPLGLVPPDGAVVAEAVVFEPGTGYPLVDGVRRAAAFVISDRDDPASAAAIVVGASATIRTFRRQSGSWKEDR